jgi:1,4-alpha-glucan branching enzyme
VSPAGSFSFVFHSHIPYARQAGRWPHGEEWVHEAAAETYIPLLNALNDLLSRGVRPRLTLSLTPILVEQLADPDIQRNFVDYLGQKIEAAEEDVPRFEESGQAHLHYLAGFYLDWYRGILQSFQERYSGNLIPAFRALQDAGALDILTCAATHAYLPLLSHDESIHLQLRTAVESYKRHFGRPPRGIWLPECAYRPAYFTDENVERPGLEALLAAHGISYFFAETHMIEGGLPVGVAAGEVIGPYGAVRRRYVVPFSESRPPQPTTTFQPYYVTEPQVAVLGRENRAGLQVWSAQWGYPGEYDYREFHKKDGRSGLQYWRVTGAQIDLGSKDEYHPDWAHFKAGQHADHFAHLVSGLLQEYHAKSGRHGILCAMYDTELFGHWWFEGVEWIAGVLERLAQSDQVELDTVGGFLEGHPPDTAIHLPEGSWGAGGNHFVWDNADNSWMWPIVHAAERRMAESVRRWPQASGAARQALDQAARELVLLQASDWPFLITTGQAKEYAISRFQQHVERFEALLSGVEQGTPDSGLAQELWERDKVFPEMDYRWFSK